jgi:hypothetical protein
MTETLRRGYPGMKVIASERLGCAPRGSKGSRHKCIADPSQIGLHVTKDKLVTFSWFLLFYTRHLGQGDSFVTGHNKQVRLCVYAVH